MLISKSQTEHSCFETRREMFGRRRCTGPTWYSRRRKGIEKAHETIPHGRRQALQSCLPLLCRMVQVRPAAGTAVVRQQVRELDYQGPAAENTGILNSYAVSAFRMHVLGVMSLSRHCSQHLTSCACAGFWALAGAPRPGAEPAGAGGYCAAAAAWGGGCTKPTPHRPCISRKHRSELELRIRIQPMGRKEAKEPHLPLLRGLQLGRCWRKGLSRRWCGGVRAAQRHHDALRSLHRRHRPHGPAPRAPRVARVHVRLRLLPSARIVRRRSAAPPASSAPRKHHAASRRREALRPRRVRVLRAESVVPRAP
jgi:hypothetical protein